MFNILIKYLLFSVQFLYISSATQKQHVSKPNEKKGEKCTLTNKPSQDPLPSLSQCYKYNNEACCLSVHDDYVREFVSSLLPTACLGKYTQFEDLMCLGCHPLEATYINKENKTINICKEYAMSVWNATDMEQLNNSTTFYDNCGFKSDAIEAFKGLENMKYYLIPSENFDNFTHFINLIKIPFYEDYTVVLQDETNENCYNKGGLIFLTLIKYILVFLIMF